MKSTIKQLTLSVSLAVIAGPTLFGMAATAGDYGGGLHGMRGTYVPVPAPVPIPDYKAKWYLRLDAGAGFGGETSTTESGMTYGERDVTNYAGTAFSPLNGFGQKKGPDVGSTVGVGAGYYFSKYFRMDITGELLSHKSNDRNGSFSYTANPIAGSGATGTRIVSGSVSDRTNIKSGVFMANAYFDSTGVGSWRPYVGGGLGFAVSEVNRMHNTALTICDPDLGGAVGAGANAACTTTTADSHTGRGDRQYVYTLAANLQAGVSYKVSEVTSLDFNYRYLYVGGTDVTASING